jgi:hypothetical protein
MMKNPLKILNTKITCSFTLYYFIENEAPYEGCDNFRHVVPNRDFRPLLEPKGVYPKKIG